MSAVTPGTVVNRIIESLPRQQRGRVLAQCEPVDLVFGDMLCEQDGSCPHAWFPLTGVISQVALVGGHQPLEMGLIGNEGVLGATLVLGVETAPLRGLVQGSGTALKMSAGQLNGEFQDCPALHEALNRYLFVSLAQLSQTAACARFHDTEARLARWLLTAHDRAHSDHFHFTHEFLADMIGVRRSSVTIAAGALQQRSLIHYTRGEITILDRPGLEAASCECYSAAVDDYRRLLG